MRFMILFLFNPVIVFSETNKTDDYYPAPNRVGKKITIYWFGGLWVNNQCAFNPQCLALKTIRGEFIEPPLGMPNLYPGLVMRENIIECGTHESTIITVVRQQK